MKLLLDIGNSRIKVATLDGQGLQVHTALASTNYHALAEFVATLGSGVTWCMASSVAANAHNNAIEQALAPLPVRWAQTSHSAAGVANAYPDPSQLGVDRWVAMLGLTRHFSGEHPPLVLANFGTATTIDTLSPHNRFEGGLILPGITMMHESLALGTANLPNERGAIQAFPTTTVSAISSGISAAQIGAVTRQLALAEQQFGQPPVLCVSGGALDMVRDDLASELTRYLPLVAIHELPHVVLDGLDVLARLDS